MLRSHERIPSEAQRNSEVEPTRALQQKLHGDQGTEKPQAGPWQVGIEQISNHDADNSAEQYQAPRLDVSILQGEHNSYNAARHECRHQQKRQEQCALHGFVHDEQAAADVEDPTEQAQDEASPLLCMKAW